MNDNKELTPEYNLKLLSLGETGVGKTSIVSQFVNHIFQEECQTTSTATYYSKILTLDNENKFSISFSNVNGTPLANASVSLIVGDGDKTRSYRDALLSENLNKIGVAHGDHKDYRECSVITVCNDFINADGSNDAIDY